MVKVEVSQISVKPHWELQNAPTYQNSKRTCECERCLSVAAIFCFLISKQKKTEERGRGAFPDLNFYFSIKSFEKEARMEINLLLTFFYPKKEDLENDDEFQAA